MKRLLQRQRLALNQYQVSDISSDQRKACVTLMQPVPGDLYCQTFHTEILSQRSSISGMSVKCTCKRNLNGSLCDHVAAHAEHTGIYELENLVHPRDQMQYYKAQYPSLLPEYPDTSFNNLQANENIYLPVIPNLRRGRPRKSRYISKREECISNTKRKLKGKTQRNNTASIDDSKHKRQRLA